MMSIIGRTAFSFFCKATKTAAIDTARVVGVTGVGLGGYHLYNKVTSPNQNGFFSNTLQKPNLKKIPEIKLNKGM